MKKKFFNPNDQRYLFYIAECVNDYAIQVLHIGRCEYWALTKQVALQMDIVLPDNEEWIYNSTDLDFLEGKLAELAELNHWVEVKY